MPLTADQIVAGMKALIAEHEKPAIEPFRLVTPWEDLQAALDSATVPIHLVAGATYSGVTLPSGARLIGHGAILEGVGRRALYVAPGSTDWFAQDLVCTSDRDSVVQLGDNASATQSLSSQAPSGVLERVRIPSHRGKRGFEVHAVVDLVNCEALDVYFPGVPGGGTESQGLWIHNTPGPVRVFGGRYQGGSECLLTAGDTYRLTDVPAPDGLLFEDVLFDRPMAWKGDTSVYRQVKNIFEIKNGRNVIVRRCTFRNCWKEAQDGYAIMLTPTQGCEVVNVAFEDCVVENASGWLNITGKDSSGKNQTRTTGIRWTGGSVQTNRAVLGGSGRTVLLTSGVGTLDIAHTTVDHDGTSFVYAALPQVERLTVTHAEFQAGKYGFFLAGGANAAMADQGAATFLVSNCHISGAAAVLKANLPDTNTYA